MLQVDFSISWLLIIITNMELYGDLTNASDKVETQTSRSLSQAPRATRFPLSLVGNYPWKEESRMTSQNHGRHLKEATGMANIGQLRTMIQN